MSRQLSKSKTGAAQGAVFLLIIVLLIIALLIGALAAGCTRSAKVHRGPDEQLPEARWTVSGVRPGMSLGDIVSVLGEPSTSYGPEDHRGHHFEDPDLTVVCNSDEVAIRISAPTLERDGQVVLRAGDDGSSVRSLLGDGYVIERFSPKGGGVIATGSVSNGQDHYHHDATVRFHFRVSSSGAVGRIVAGTLESLPRPTG